MGQHTHQTHVLHHKELRQMLVSAKRGFISLNLSDFRKGSHTFANGID